MKIYKVSTRNFVIGHYFSLELAEKSRDEHHERELKFYHSQFESRKKAIEETILPAFLLRNEIDMVRIEIFPRYDDIEDLKGLKEENTSMELAIIEEIEMVE